jgi:hypothetical protein
MSSMKMAACVIDTVLGELTVVHLITGRSIMEASHVVSSPPNERAAVRVRVMPLGCRTYTVKEHLTAELTIHYNEHQHVITMFFNDKQSY